MKMYGRRGKDVVVASIEDETIPARTDLSIGSFLRTEMVQPLKDGDKWLPERRFVVSTTFLSIDHNYMDHGDPIVFETMVFEIKEKQMDFTDLYCKRFSDYNDAVANHIEVIGEINAGRLTFEERPDV